MKKRLFLTSIVLLLAAGLFGCEKPSDSTEQATPQTTLRIGAYAGPYYDLFREAIQPELERQGYQIKAINFPGMLETDTALAEEVIDFNVSQHTAYMNAFNAKKGSDIVSVIHIPSIPAGLFSNKIKNLNDIQQGAVVAIPLDPANAARAYNLLAKAGWIELKPDADPVFATREDIVANPYELNIREIAMGNIPRVVQDVDAAVIPGSVMFSAGFKGKDALILETIAPDLEIIVAVNSKDRDQPWVKAIENAYASQAFKDYVQKHDTDGMWVWPEH